MTPSAKRHFALTLPHVRGVRFVTLHTLRFSSTQERPLTVRVR